MGDPHAIVSGSPAFGSSDFLVFFLIYSSGIGKPSPPTPGTSPPSIPTDKEIVGRAFSIFTGLCELSGNCAEEKFPSSHQLNVNKNSGPPPPAPIRTTGHRGLIYFLGPEPFLRRTPGGGGVQPSQRLGSSQQPPSTPFLLPPYRASVFFSRPHTGGGKNWKNESRQSPRKMSFVISRVSF